MYFVKYGDEYLHDPRVVGYSVSDLMLETEENSCGYCDFTIYPNHPLYNKLKERDADNQIEVYDDDILLFAGFIYELGKEFYLDGHVKCKGELDYLSESIVRPYSTVTRGYGSKVSDHPRAYFEWLIEQHNQQVAENKRFVVGINEGGKFTNAYGLFRENDSYPRTIDEISEQLLNSEFAGGYLRVRHENGVRYIDYLYEWSATNTQILDFGVNLTNYTQTDDSSEMATYIVPLGGRMIDTGYAFNDGYFQTTDSSPQADKVYYTVTEDGYYSQCEDGMSSFTSGVTYYEYNMDNDESNRSLTLELFTDGEYLDEGYVKSGDMIYYESGVKKYGWIGTSQTFPDIVDVSELFVEGLYSLKELVSPKRTIEIRAVDMHIINPSYKPIRIGEYVRVRSNPHKLDSYFLCTSIDLDLSNPENSLYILGTTFDTLTGQQNSKIKALNASVNKQVDAVTSIKNEAQQLVKRTETLVASAGRVVSRVENTVNETSSIAASASAAVSDMQTTVSSIQTSSALAMDKANAAVTAIVTEYALSTDATTSPTTGWSSVSPTRAQGEYVWYRVKTTYGNGTVTTSTPAMLTGNTGDKGEDAVLLRIDSSRGTVFKNDAISTVLSVTIYKGSDAITDITTLKSVFGTSAYLQWSWQKINENTFGVISSADSMIGNDGFTLSISSEEVDAKVTFKCELII